MKVRVGVIRRLVREAIGSDHYMGEEEARQHIMDMDGDEIVDTDIVDEQSGEIYLKQGDSYDESPWSPDHKVNTRRAGRDEVYAQRAGVWKEYHAEDGELDNEVDEIETARKAYRQALHDFTSSLTNFADDSPEMNPADVSYDIADNFFREYPEWRVWAKILDIEPHFFRDNIADYAYDAMTSGQASSLN